MGNQEELERVWGDFTRFAAVCVFVDMCIKKENPKEHAEALLRIWEERINSELKKEKQNFEDREDWKSIFGQSISDESVKKTKQAAESVKTAVLNAVTKARNSTIS